jgi:hypothetical protein
MCGRVRLSSDVSEIKLVFSIPPHRATPNIAEGDRGSQTHRWRGESGANSSLKSVSSAGLMNS